MEPERFDRWTRGLAHGASRRRVLGGLVAGLAFGGASRARLAAAQTCNLGACHANADCTCAGVETCGGNGLCCRTTLGMYCNDDPAEVGSQCCGPAYVCASSGVFPPPAGGGCQCAPGYIECGGQCISQTHCCTNGQPGCGTNEVCNPNHGICDCQSGFARCNGQCISTQHCCSDPNATGFVTCGANQTCVNGGCQNTCLANGQAGNPNHPDLCCSGCVCPDGNCCDASHCQNHCQSGFALCNGQCLSTQHCCSDPHASGFVTCDADQTCVDGRCQPNAVRCGSNKQLCQAPGFTSKCCPQGHQCHQHPQSGTFDCRTTKNTHGKRGKRHGKH